MTAIGIAITSGLVGIVVGFLVAAWLAAEAMRKQEEKLSAAGRVKTLYEGQIKELVARCNRLSIVNSAAKTRIDSLNRQLARLS